MKKYLVICIDPLGEQGITGEFETEDAAWKYADLCFSKDPTCDFYVAKIL